jgi:hypothetical protein
VVARLVWRSETVDNLRWEYRTVDRIVDRTVDMTVDTLRWEYRTVERTVDMTAIDRTVTDRTVVDKLR